MMPLLSYNDWARFWFNEIGVNVIPATNKHDNPDLCKKPFWTDSNKNQIWITWKKSGYQTNPISEDQFNEWIRLDAFKDGMAIICGQVWRGENKGKWLNAIDCDNKLAVDEWCEIGIIELSKITIVEQHANKEKCHVLYFTEEPIQNKGALIGENIPKIEVKSLDKNLLYCAGGIHKDGSLIEIVGTDKIKTQTKDALEKRLDEIFTKYGLEYLPKNKTDFPEPLYKVEGKLHEGSNRGVHILSYLASKIIWNGEFSRDILFSITREWEKEHCVGVYDDKKIWELVDQAIEFSKDKKKPIITENENESFTISRKNRNYSVQVLTHEIQSIRPITLLEDGTRMILAYLPVKVQEIDKENKLGESKFENKAFFIMSGKEKKRLPADHKDLKENYKINVLPSGFELRWNLADLNQWLDESEKSNPKDLYDLHLSLIKKYLDFEHENDYVYFNLWNTATYFYELFGAFPYNDYTGTKRAGKTKALEFQSHVCFNAILSPDISGSALFRTIEGTGATVLLDETEAFKNTKNEQAQQVRTLLLEGFLKDKLAIRTEGSSDNGFTVTNFNLFSPKSMGHINTLDDVLGDRCIELLMLRSKDKDKLNTWPTKRDSNFVKIRNLCYRLFLDFGDEIFDLQEKARGLLNVSGRELQVWTPIITMALFFENHGCELLINSIKEKITKSSGERQITDEQGNKELKILRFIDDKILSIVNEVVGQKKNPPGWIIVSEIYKKLTEGDTAKEYGINLEYYKQKQLTEDLHRIGFKQERKSAGYSWEITNDTVKSAKERLGMIDPKDYKCQNCNVGWKYTIKTIEDIALGHDKGHVIVEVLNV